MSLKEFDLLFGTTETLDKAKDSFVQRINSTIFTPLEQGRFSNRYEETFRAICYDWGVNPDDLLSEANHYLNYNSLIVPSPRKLTGDDFVSTLRMLVVVYKIINSSLRGQFNAIIELALGASSVDVGVRWTDGMFYPSGAKELDEKLVSDNLQWLSKFPDTKNFFSTSLKHFGNSIEDPSARKDAITNAYTAIEDITRKVLGNKQNFEKNSNSLVAWLGLTDEYKNIVHYYKQIAHEYGSRHAGSEITHAEAEAFIYLTGILLRLISQNKDEA